MPRPLTHLEEDGRTGDPTVLCRLPGVGPAPLACAWRPDGSLVVIATDGRKLHFSAAQLAVLEEAAPPPVGTAKKRRPRRP